MSNQGLSFQVSAEIGSVSAEYIIPEKPISIMTLAHGAGAGMHHKFLVELANALAEKQTATLRFNFPFIENKKKRPDFPVVAHKTIEKAISEANTKFPELPLFVSGKSFGGRMSSQYMSQHANAAVKGLIFFGFPLHAIKKPSTDRAEHLKEVKVPMLFLQGTRDQLAEWNSIEQVCSELSNATLIKLEGADHAFKKGKENLVPGLAKQTRDWIDTII
jgi:predicted alpha/beta-hydrolase family hydrolase